MQERGRGGLLVLLARAAERAAAERAVATAAAARAGEGSVAGWVEAVGTAARVGVGLAVAATAGAAMAGHN